MGSDYYLANRDRAIHGPFLPNPSEMLALIGVLYAVPGSREWVMIRRVAEYAESMIDGVFGEASDEVYDHWRRLDHRVRDAPGDPDVKAQAKRAVRKLAECCYLRNV